MSNPKEKIREAISKSKIKKAINLLDNYLSEIGDRKSKSNLATISAAYYRLLNKQNKGIILSEYERVEANRINDSLLSLLENAGQKTSTEKKKSRGDISNNIFLIFLLGFLWSLIWNYDIEYAFLNREVINGILCGFSLALFFYLELSKFNFLDIGFITIVWGICFFIFDELSSSYSNFELLLWGGSYGLSGYFTTLRISQKYSDFNFKKANFSFLFWFLSGLLCFSIIGEMENEYICYIIGFGTCFIGLGGTLFIMRNI